MTSLKIEGVAYPLSLEGETRIPLGKDTVIAQRITGGDGVVVFPACRWRDSGVGVIVNPGQHAKLDIGQSRGFFRRHRVTVIVT